MPERKAADTRLRRLNRLYATLSQCNKAIVRSTGEEELFAQVCRVAVQAGGMKMAWVGLIDTETRMLRLAASFGDGVEHLRDIRISVDASSPFGGGPTGIAIRENRPYWCEDYLNSPITAPWRAAGARYGSAAMAALPLHRNGAVIGAFILYSAEANAFDDSARDLLVEIAMDISFALDNFVHKHELAWATEALRASELSYRQLFAANPHPMWVYDLETLRFLAVNDAAMTRYGYSRDEFEAMTVADIRPTEDVPRLQDNIARVEGGKVDAADVGRHRKKDGALIDVEITSHVLDFGGRRAELVLAHDVTERKRAEESLHAAEEQFRSLVEQPIAGIFIVQDAKLAYLNPRFAEILGYASAQELVGRDLLSIVAEKDHDIVAETLRQRIKGVPRSASFEFTVLRKDGSTIEVSAHGHRASHRGRPAIISLIQDITEKKRAEAQIQRYIEQLKTAFMSTVEVTMSLSEMRDPYTTGHERRVAEIATAIGAELGLDGQRIEGLRVAGYLHDIGKIAIPSEILSKPGKLSAIEFQLIKEHARAGYDVLKDVDFPWPLAEVALQHHERMDGSGYPQGLKSEVILIEARIMAVADVVEAMASHRPYRPALGVDKALAEIERGRESAYDPTVADACLRLFRERGYTIAA